MKPLLCHLITFAIIFIYFSQLSSGLPHPQDRLRSTLQGNSKLSPEVQPLDPSSRQKRYGIFSIYINPRDPISRLASTWFNRMTGQTDQRPTLMLVKPEWLNFFKLNRHKPDQDPCSSHNSNDCHNKTHHSIPTTAATQIVLPQLSAINASMAHVQTSGPPVTLMPTFYPMHMTSSGSPGGFMMVAQPVANMNGGVSLNLQMIPSISGGTSLPVGMAIPVVMAPGAGMTTNDSQISVNITPQQSQISQPPLMIVPSTPPFGQIQPSDTIVLVKPSGQGSGPQFGQFNPNNGPQQSQGPLLQQPQLTPNNNVGNQVQTPPFQSPSSPNQPAPGSFELVGGPSQGPFIPAGLDMPGQGQFPQNRPPPQQQSQSPFLQPGNGPVLQPQGPFGPPPQQQFQQGQNQPGLSRSFKTEKGLEEKSLARAKKPTRTMFLQDSLRH